MEFWRPGDPKGPVRKIDAQAGSSGKSNSQQSFSPEKLHFLYALEQNQVICIQVDPKTDIVTDLPYTLVAAGWSRPKKTVAVALPRQVKVLTAASRLARKYALDDSQLGGDQVGFVIPGNTRRSTDTNVVYYTCEALLDNIRCDPLLNFLSVVILDEMHERYISTDLIVALLRQIQRVRSELRIVLCGTFFNMAEVEVFFAGRKTACIQLSTSEYPVSVMHLKEPVADFMKTALETVQDCFEEWNRKERPFDRHVLVFVSGADQADRLCQEIAEWFTTDMIPTLRLRKQPLGQKPRDLSSLLRAVPLHASVGQMQYTEATQSDRTHPHLKVVVATNLAESAVVVNEVSTVIDCGFEKVHIYDTRTKLSSLAVVPISRASARQRAKTAGRSGPGVCFRLYTQSFFENEMLQYRPAEILRRDLSTTVLALKTLGIDTVGTFQFMTQPPIETFADGVDHLYHLGVIDLKGALTKDLGVRMVGLNLSPEIMKCIVLSEEYGVGREMAGLAAMLEVRNSVFFTARKSSRQRSPFSVAEGDLLTLLNVWRRYSANGRSHNWCKEQGINISAMQKAYQHFQYITKRVLKRQTKEERFAAGRKMIGLKTAECVRRCVAGGFYENACMVQPDGSYLMVTSGRRMWIHSSSTLCGRMPKWLLFIDAVHLGDKLYMRDVTVIEPQWLVDAAPDIYETMSAVRVSQT